MGSLPDCLLTFFNSSTIAPPIAPATAAADTINVLVAVQDCDKSTFFMKHLFWLYKAFRSFAALSAACWLGGGPIDAENSRNTEQHSRSMSVTEHDIGPCTRAWLTFM